MGISQAYMEMFDLNCKQRNALFYSYLFGVGSEGKMMKAIVGKVINKSYTLITHDLRLSYLWTESGMTPLKSYLSGRTKGHENAHTL